MPSSGKRSTGLASRKRRTSSANATSAAVKANSIRSVPSHELLHGRPEVRASAVEMRMDGKRQPAQVGRLAILAEGQVAERLTRERSEMIRIAGQCLAAIGDGADVVLGEVAHGRAL